MGKAMHYDELIPPLSDFGFKNLFGKGDESKENLRFLTNEELHEYHQWLKVTNDDRLRLQEAESKGIAKGKEEGRTTQAWESAKILFSKNMPLDLISEVTGISESELKAKL